MHRILCWQTRLHMVGLHFGLHVVMIATTVCLHNHSCSAVLWDTVHQPGLVDFQMTDRLCADCLAVDAWPQHRALAFTRSVLLLASHGTTLQVVPPSKALS
mmetsp:Transcript_84770/g.274016  ORF Transcript_84770/g.274016 Transcript_84770/m.274016 type:complete len:101 (-) Transcript_84770:17-319(-)